MPAWSQMALKQHGNDLKYQDLPGHLRGGQAGPVKRKKAGVKWLCPGREALLSRPGLAVGGRGGPIAASRRELQHRTAVTVVRYLSFTSGFWQTCLRMLEAKDHQQILVSSGVLDLTFASRSRA